MNETVKVFTLAIALALVSWWLVARHPQEVTDVKRPDTPFDYYSTGVERREMNRAGIEVQRLTATRMTHFPEGDRTELDNPVLELRDPIRPPWVIHAETGTISQRGALIELHGKVRIDRAGYAGVAPLTIVTTNLRVKPQTRFAETSEFAEIDQPPRHATGVGMEAEIVEQLKLNLLSRVRTRYDVN